MTLDIPALPAKSYSQPTWAWRKGHCNSNWVTPSCHCITYSDSSQLNTLLVTYSVDSQSSDFFFFLRGLTTKHLKGTHRTDSWAETIWQKLVRQFQVRPTTSSTRTSQLGQQAFTATGCCFSTKSSSLRKSFMKLLFFHGTCHWHSPYSTKFVASSFGRWKKKRNHAVYKDMLLRHMFLYFLNNNGFTEDLWLITEFFLFKYFAVDVI